MLIVTKELSWLWRMAHNSAVNALSVWDDGDVTEMFSVARDVSSSSFHMPYLTLYAADGSKFQMFAH
jgi:hypothetical protein